MKTVNGLKSKTLKVDYLARVEGEGALYVKVRRGEVMDAKLKIFEPPRFFEAFLRGRYFTEPPDITARICGICPVAYQMSSVHAMEYVCDVKVDGALRELRRLLYCGEWIESHVLHMFMLHAPDFLGYQDVIEMARDHGELVKNVLRLKKIGNDIVNVLGGREIHPINVRVGGFYRIPPKEAYGHLLDELKWGRDFAVEATKLVGTFDFPEFERDYEFVALRHENEYPFNEGRLVSNRGLDIAVSEYEQVFAEEHVEHSNALHSHKIEDGGAYFVGPLARFNLNYDKLTPLARKTAQKIGFKPECRNPFKSIIARGIETIYAFDEAIRILEKYPVPEKPYIEIAPRAGTGYGCTEAPRGILYHRYRIDGRGHIMDAKIVPPTSQNQKTIDQDLTDFVAKYMDLDDKELTWKCEQAIRNYDPCISCATHFLKLEIDRE